MHGLEVCVLAFAEIRASRGKERECPVGDRAVAETGPLLSTPERYAVEDCARTRRAASLALLGVGGCAAGAPQSRSRYLKAPQTWAGFPAVRARNRETVGLGFNSAELFD